MNQEADSSADHFIASAERPLGARPWAAPTHERARPISGEWWVLLVGCVWHVRTPVASALLRGSCISSPAVMQRGMQDGTGQKLAMAGYWSNAEPAESLRNSWGQSASQPGGVQEGFLERRPSRRQEYLGSREAEGRQSPRESRPSRLLPPGQGECDPQRQQTPVFLSPQSWGRSPPFLRAGTSGWPGCRD